MDCEHEVMTSWLQVKQNRYFDLLAVACYKASGSSFGWCEPQNSLTPDHLWIKKKNILQYADGLGHHLTLHKICELIIRTLDNTHNFTF